MVILYIKDVFDALKRIVVLTLISYTWMFGRTLTRLRVCLCLQDQSLRDEVASLRLQLSEREEALKDAMERVKSSNRTKDSMEHFIVSQRESLTFLISLLEQIKQ